MRGDGGTVVLSASRCRSLLREHRLGRFAYVDDDQPVIVPVDYVVDDGDVYVRTGPGGKAAAAAEGARVALQVDDLRPVGEPPWSVLAVGRATLVAAGDVPDELLERLQPSAGTLGRSLVVRLAVDRLEGRRLDGFGRLGG
jgi:nitroimidazol reductase NimA-like FMN-containing flavoprotein (pyridoxamine 5'-phosphate oxidase superfamily)